jgi:hypothetical protein
MVAGQVEDQQVYANHQQDQMPDRPGNLTHQVDNRVELGDGLLVTNHEGRHSPEDLRIPEGLLSGLRPMLDEHLGVGQITDLVGPPNAFSLKQDRGVKRHAYGQEETEARAVPSQRRKTTPKCIASLCSG